MSEQRFTVRPASYAADAEALYRVRHTVFVEEQQVPVEMERDELDPLCDHVIALDMAGRPIGTGRLTPEQRIGRMAVLPAWRGQGVGDALLNALLEQAKAKRWPTVSLHAQVSAEDFYLRHGFVPRGARFMEAGIEHQDMSLGLHISTLVDSKAAAVAALRTLIERSHRNLCIYTHALDPGLLDHPQVLESFRCLVTRPGPIEIRVLLHDARAPQRDLSPLLPLMQRLPSAWSLKEVTDPIDISYASAYLANDRGDWYFRPLEHRPNGETRLADASRARQLREEFGHVWSRARVCTALRALHL